MAFIEIFLLQSPKIVLDSVPCRLPYQKAEALLYFIAVEKRVTREQAASLLWDGCDESAARKNLRHAVYTVKKALGAEYIIPCGRQELCLNPEFTVVLDYDRLMIENQADAYQDEFLNSFYIKNAPAFEEWMLTKRQYALHSYLKLLYRQISLLPASGIDEAERLFARYLKEDALDESVYRLMMERYEACGLYYKGIKLYRRLALLMEKELSASPGGELKRLHRRLLDALSEDRPLIEKPEEVLPGREHELHFLSDAFKRFLNGRSTAILLSGGDGSGKTYLAEQFTQALSERSFLVLKASCLETESDVLLQPLSCMVLQLQSLIGLYGLKVDSGCLEAASRLFPMSGAIDDTAFSLLFQLLFGIGEQTPLVLFFDNLHYIDSASLDFISLLLRGRNPNILFLGTASANANSRLSAVLRPLADEKLLLTLELSPIVKDVRGNLIKAESGQAAEQQFAALLQSLTPVEKSVLELLSACQSHAALSLFEDLLGKSPLELLDALEHLKALEILEESKELQNVCFVFRSSSLRKRIYEQMSLSKRCYFHRTLAEHLKHLDGFGASDYECLIYHYCHCGNPAMELKYRILTLEEYTNRNYELYPMQYAAKKQYSGSIPSLTDYCDSLEDRLLSLSENEAASIPFSHLYALLLRTKAQYCVTQGRYREGLDSLKKALLLNRQNGDEPLMRIRCLRLINFYRLNIWNTKELESSLSECLRLGREGGYEEDYAIDCRLYGLFKAMEGNYPASLRYLKRALRLFSLYPQKSRVYTLNIAGCYNYMGETYRKQKQFERAIRFYQKAIQTCEAGHASGNAVFYSNLGRAWLALGNPEESAAAFYRSDRLYEESHALIGRSITKGYISILEAEKGNFDAARTLLAEAQTSARHLASPNSLGLLALASRELAARWPDEFSALLPESPEFYWKEALGALKNIPGAYEIEEECGLTRT